RRQSRAYWPTGAVTVTKKDGWLFGLGKLSPLFTTAEPSKGQGLPSVPQDGSEGASTFELRTAPFSSFAGSGWNTAYGPPGCWFWPRHWPMWAVGTRVAVCGVSLPAHAALITSPVCTAR